eukprot:TRINITY_DN1318_c0_g1_i1.p1 TRINITY_DN1318_c0_g1~~TRINITY_DN1318_c0_g1_i1.p1  ORF type:complete len:207 (-),score=29.71 TRINITY_DN1318_c0_g1_i1:16-615(-)
MLRHTLPFLVAPRIPKITRTLPKFVGAIQSDRNDGKKRDFDWYDAFVAAKQLERPIVTAGASARKKASAGRWNYQTYRWTSIYRMRNIHVADCLIRGPGTWREEDKMLTPHVFKLHLVSVQKPTDEPVFIVPCELTKPEIKRYLKAVYDLNVLRVRTCNYRGRIRIRGPLAYKTADFKKAYCLLPEAVCLNPLYLSQRK